MDAIILAGGMGTRLQKVLEDVPKPMAPVRGNPFLYYLFHWIRRYPVDRIVLSVGYKSNNISDYFGSSFGTIAIEYMLEEQPLGTGGAIKYAMQKTRGENILILNGDTWFPIDLNEFYSFHTGGRNIFSVALKKMHNFSRYGTVECHDDTIVRFNEKKFCHEGLINGGIYLINRDFIESEDMPDVFSLEKEILEKKAPSGIIKGLVSDAPFIDIGIPEDYRKAEDMLTDK
jgi:D-glycero-alpha-D-manno-heptose 1-phosphate guanylyltransferase